MATLGFGQPQFMATLVFGLMVETLDWVILENIGLYYSNKGYILISLIDSFKIILKSNLFSHLEWISLF